MSNEICANCGMLYKAHCCEDGKQFKPSGNVSVPAAFLEAVRELLRVINDPGSKFAELCDAVEKVTAMLDQIKGGEK